MGIFEDLVARVTSLEKGVPPVVPPVIVPPIVPPVIPPIVPPVVPIVSADPPDWANGSPGMLDAGFADKALDFVIGAPSVFYVLENFVGNYLAGCFLSNVGAALPAGVTLDSANLALIWDGIGSDALASAPGIQLRATNPGHGYGDSLVFRIRIFLPTGAGKKTATWTDYGPISGTGTQNRHGGNDMRWTYDDVTRFVYHCGGDPAPGRSGQYRNIFAFNPVSNPQNWTEVYPQCGSVGSVQPGVVDAAMWVADGGKIWWGPGSNSGSPTANLACPGGATLVINENPEHTPITGGGHNMMTFDTTIKKWSLIGEAIGVTPPGSFNYCEWWHKEPGTDNFIHGPNSTGGPDLFRINTKTLAWSHVDKASQLGRSLFGGGQPCVREDIKKMYLYTRYGEFACIDIGTTDDFKILLSGLPRTSSFYQTMQWNEATKCAEVFVVNGSNGTGFLMIIDPADHNPANVKWWAAPIGIGGAGRALVSCRVPGVGTFCTGGTIYENPAYINHMWGVVTS